MSQQVDDESFDAVIDKATFDSILRRGRQRARRALSVRGRKSLEAGWDILAPLECAARAAARNLL